MDSSPPMAGAPVVPQWVVSVPVPEARTLDAERRRVALRAGLFTALPVGLGLQLLVALLPNITRNLFWSAEFLPAHSVVLMVACWLAVPVLAAGAIARFARFVVRSEGERSPDLARAAAAGAAGWSTLVAGSILFLRLGRFPGMAVWGAIAGVVALGLGLIARSAFRAAPDPERVEEGLPPVYSTLLATGVTCTALVLSRLAIKVTGLDPGTWFQLLALAPLAGLGAFAARGLAPESRQDPTLLGAILPVLLPALLATRPFFGADLLAQAPLLVALFVGPVVAAAGASAWLGYRLGRSSASVRLAGDPARPASLPGRGMKRGR